ncbi:6856_t:CDS:2, partial [Acaulospora colombiana]
MQGGTEELSEIVEIRHRFHRREGFGMVLCLEIDVPIPTALISYDIRVAIGGREASDYDTDDAHIINHEDLVKE